MLKRIFAAKISLRAKMDVVIRIKQRMGSSFLRGPMLQIVKEGIGPNGCHFRILPQIVGGIKERMWAAPLVSTSQYEVKPWSDPPNADFRIRNAIITGIE